MWCFSFSAKSVQNLISRCLFLTAQNSKDGKHNTDPYSCTHAHTHKEAKYLIRKSERGIFRNLRWGRGNKEHSIVWAQSFCIDVTIKFLIAPQSKQTSLANYAAPNINTIHDAFAAIPCKQETTLTVKFNRSRDFTCWKGIQRDPYMCYQTPFSVYCLHTFLPLNRAFCSPQWNESSVQFLHYKSWEVEQTSN
jgi:hypothetical protein